MHRRVTIVDVARAAGISVSSASVALRGEPGVSQRTREHVLSTAERLGYQPDQRARVLREQRARLVGVTFTVDHTFDAAVLGHLYAAAAELSHDLLLSAATGARSGVEAAESLLRDRCPALLLISPAVTAAELARIADRAPVVTLGSDLRAPGVDSVRSDDRRGVADAVDHLVGLGHRSIAFVDGGRGVMAAVRRDGYRAAMAGHGLPARIEALRGDPTEEAGVEAARRILHRGERPTAILAHNDQLAVGALLTLRSRGVAVPGELSVVGYDDSRLAALSAIGLTSVSQDAARLARLALSRAAARAERPDTPPEELVAAPTLVVRDTSAAPPPR